MEGPEIIGIGAMGVLVMVGLISMLVPTKAILSWEGLTFGNSIYQMVLRSSGDEAKALRAAGLFYKLFGAAFVLVGGWFLVMALSAILGR